jgi:hypothetical protein
VLQLEWASCKRKRPPSNSDCQTSSLGRQGGGRGEKGGGGGHVVSDVEGGQVGLKTAKPVKTELDLQWGGGGGGGGGEGRSMGGSKRARLSTVPAVDNSVIVLD